MIEIMNTLELYLINIIQTKQMWKNYYVAEIWIVFEKLRENVAGVAIVKLKLYIND